jgi:hypothetical protein
MAARDAINLVVCLVLLTRTKCDAPATGNFGLSTSSCYFSDILYNPPAFSTYLAEAGRGATLQISLDGATPVPLSALFTATPPPVFPECAMSASISPGVVLRWRAFAPLSPDDEELGFLPLLLGALTLQVTPPAPPFSRNATLLYRFFCGSDEGARAACGGHGSGGYVRLPTPGGGAVNLSAGALFVGASGGYAAGAHCAIQSGVATLCAELSVVAQPGQAAFGSGVILVGHHVPAGRYALQFPDPLNLAAYGAENVQRLAAHHAAFVSSIPSTGWPDVDAGLRSWLHAPVLLTKGVGARVLTMGYVELNARDSFWTTAGLHAVFWPALESVMLRESCEFACSPGGGPPSYCRAEDHGKIPTCVLPTIVRDDNVDITAFWALRLGRYFAATGDTRTLQDLYPCLRSALLYLQRRAAPGEALPSARARSYWGSWLDVPFLKGRKLMADNSALYIAAQRFGAQAATVLAAALQRAGGSPSDLEEDAHNFSAARVAGLRQLTAELSDGGQWDSAVGALRDTWWDGRVSGYALGDQFMAVYFNVLSRPRASSLLAYLTGASGLEGPYGIRALFPYQVNASDPWGGYYPAGVYANGGSYAWLTCGTVLALAAGGDSAAAWRVWRKMTTRMFAAGARGLAYEYLQSETGDRMGNAPQGWDGVCAAWAWGGGAVRWWRESPASDVGARGGVVGGEGDGEEEGEGRTADSALEHVYHLTLPDLRSLGSGSSSRRREPRLPLLLPLLSLHGHFARCSFPVTAGGWGVLPSICEIVAGIEAGPGELGDVVWRTSSPCVIDAPSGGASRGFRCDVSDTDVRVGSQVRIVLE